MRNCALIQPWQLELETARPKRKGDPLKEVRRSVYMYRMRFSLCRFGFIAIQLSVETRQIPREMAAASWSAYCKSKF